MWQKPRYSERWKSSGLRGWILTSTAKWNIHEKLLMLCIWCIMSCWILAKLLPWLVSESNRIILSREHGQKLADSYSRLDKIIVLLNNVRLLVAASVKTYLEIFNCEMQPHSPYFSDIALSHYQLFRSMARCLSEQHFRLYKGTKNWVNSWIV